VAWNHVRVSPRIRAGRTAELLLAASGRSDLEVRVDDRLAELDFGPYEGWTERQLADDPLASRRRQDGAELPGMEPVESVAERASAVWADLSTLPGNTLVVGHGRMLRALIVLKVLGAPASAVSALRLRHCRPTIIEPGKRPLLLGLNVGNPADEGIRDLT
jgi:broad specificity phosphatase PhoE